MRACGVTFSARRQGGAVQSFSAEADKTALLRFYGFFQRTDRVPAGEFLYLCTHAVTIVRCHRGERYVQTVDFSACQAITGATNVERSCYRAVRTSRYYPHFGCREVRPTGVLCSTISLPGPVYSNRGGRG